MVEDVTTSTKTNIKLKRLLFARVRALIIFSYQWKFDLHSVMFSYSGLRLEMVAHIILHGYRFTNFLEFYAKFNIYKEFNSVGNIQYIIYV